MGRAEERAKRKLEKNPVVECNRIREKYCPDLFRDFGDTKDPRHLSYIEYSNRELLGTGREGGLPLRRAGGKDRVW